MAKDRRARAGYLDRVKTIRHGGLLCIVLTYLLLGIAYGLVLPPFENLDEPEHFEVIRYVAENGRLPVHDAPGTEAYHLRQEASQPPLYYLLSAGIVRSTGLQAHDAHDFWQFNPRVACGPEAPHLYDNRAVLRHDPHREDWPWHDTVLTLRVLRWFSTLLQVVTVVGAFALGRRLFPGRSDIPLLGAAIVAFNPQFLLVASGVNNDNLVTPLATLVLLLTARLWQERRLDLPRALLLGVLCGAAGLSKLSGWLTLVPCAALFAALWLRRDGPRLRLTLIALLIPLTALTVGSWWFWRNWQLYGDPTALGPMLALVGRRESPIHALFETGLMFRSFWGQIACAFFPAGFYVFYGLLTGLSATGLLWRWRRLRPVERYTLAALAGWFAVITLSWLRWNMMTPAPGGRLLFPALPAVALVMAAGLTGWGRPRRAAQAAIIAVALSAWWTAVAILPAFFAPPPRYRDAADVQPSRPVEAAIGEHVHLLGYDVELQERARLLHVTLYWQVDTRPEEDYLLALQLISPIAGDTTMRWNYNSWPGRGNYPTGAWQAGTVIEDRYRFDLPPIDSPTQAWDLYLVLYRQQTGERLPVRLGNRDAGTHLVLTRLRLPDGRPACPAAHELESDVLFGDAVRLTHAAVQIDADGTEVFLCWQAEHPLPADYTVFVHLLDAAGDLIAAGDGPPAAGAFPTSLWQPGDVIRDVHRLPSADLAGERILVGLYHPGDGSRLPATQDGSGVDADAILIWP